MILFQSVIQKNALEDTAVTNKMQWDNSISFMERILKERIDLANDDLEKCIGKYRYFVFLHVIGDLTHLARVCGAVSCCNAA